MIRALDLGPCTQEARDSTHRGTRACTGRSGRPLPHLSLCAAIARGSARGSTGRSRSRRTAGRAGRRLHPPSTAGTSSPPLPFSLRVKVRCERTARRALCGGRAGSGERPPQNLVRRAKRPWCGSGQIRSDRSQSAGEPSGLANFTARASLPPAKRMVIALTSRSAGGRSLETQTTHTTPTKYRIFS